MIFFGVTFVVVIEDEVDTVREVNRKDPVRVDGYANKMRRWRHLNRLWRQKVTHYDVFHMMKIHNARYITARSLSCHIRRRRRRGMICPSVRTYSKGLFVKQSQWIGILESWIFSADDQRRPTTTTPTTNIHFFCWLK
jgi:hypothetical protein